MSTLKLNYKTAVFKLCLDSKSTGTVVGQRLLEPIPFSSLPDMIFKLDYVMDMQNYPRAFQRKRQFETDGKKDASVPYATTPDEAMSAEAVDGLDGSLVTLMLQVMTRQNATWQGSISVSSERFLFDSALQMLDIIDRLTD